MTRAGYMVTCRVMQPDAGLRTKEKRALRESMGLSKRGALHAKKSETCFHRKSDVHSWTCRVSPSFWLSLVLKDSGE